MDFMAYLQRVPQSYHRLKGIIRWQHRCIMCAETSDSRICPACEAYWPLQNHHCQSCSLPLAQHGLKCGDCLKTPPIFDQAVAPYIYAPPLDQLILNFKNQRNLTMGTALCDFWQSRLGHYYQSQHLSLPDYLAPVPTHWRRQWQRGFSHTHFCAEQLSQFFSIPILRQTKMRYYSHTQKSLTRKQRLAALSSAFAIKARVDGLSIAIVDDVMTTGATANAFAKALKAAGARKVVVWVLARTPKYI